MSGRTLALHHVGGGARDEVVEKPIVPRGYPIDNEAFLLSIIL